MVTHVNRSRLRRNYGARANLRQTVRVRARTLRENVSASDGMYIALAELLDVSLAHGPAGPPPSYLTSPSDEGRRRPEPGRKGRSAAEMSRRTGVAPATKREVACARHAFRSRVATPSRCHASRSRPFPRRRSTRHRLPRPLRHSASRRTRAIHASLPARLRGTSTRDRVRQSPPQATTRQESPARRRTP